jgi:hypothetical protein
LTTFKVIYRKDGRRHWDPIRAPSADHARDLLLKYAAGMGWHIEIIRIEEDSRK